MRKIEGFFYIKSKSFILNTTFNIKFNNITALIGESGSGKTTFLKCLSGLIKPKYGFLKIDDNLILDSKENIFMHPNIRNIGHIMQNPYLFPNMSVLENVTFKKKMNKNIYTEKINIMLNIEKLYKRRTNNLSGGEKQRVVIAQIMSTQPKILLLDEAFSSQDMHMKKKLIDLFKNINIEFKTPIIYVSHDITNITKFNHHLLYMHKGKIIQIY